MSVVVNQQARNDIVCENSALEGSVGRRMATSFVVPMPCGSVVWNMNICLSVSLERKGKTYIYDTGRAMATADEFVFRSIPSDPFY